MLLWCLIENFVLKFGFEKGVFLIKFDFNIKRSMEISGKGLLYTRGVFYVRREVDLMKTAKVNAYIMHIFGKIELLSIHAT